MFDIKLLNYITGRYTDPEDTGEINEVRGHYTRTMRILVVEDEKGISNFLKDGLEEEGFAVDTTGEGVKGLELSSTNDYDLVLLDWMLPGISGIELCRQLRKTNTSVPIIFLTAKDTVQDTV